jgi:protein phosphatase
VAIVLDVPEKECHERNQIRPDRDSGNHVVRMQRSQLKRSLKSLKREGFRHIYVLSPEEIEAVTEIKRDKLYNDKKDVSGPFDIIGDVHGCYLELEELLRKLGYQLETVEDNGSNFGIKVSHPEGRRAVFLGDLVDRGPDSPAVLKLVMSMVSQKVAYCVPGNHDMKLQKKLNVKM